MFAKTLPLDIFDHALSDQLGRLLAEFLQKQIFTSCTCTFAHGKSKKSYSACRVESGLHVAHQAVEDVAPDRLH